MSDGSTFPADLDPRFLKALFPSFGVKSRVTEAVWARLGDGNRYVEPFAGSATMMLGRPTPP